MTRRGRGTSARDIYTVRYGRDADVDCTTAGKRLAFLRTGSGVQSVMESSERARLVRHELGLHEASGTVTTNACWPWQDHALISALFSTRGRWPFRENVSKTLGAVQNVGEERRTRWFQRRDVRWKKLQEKPVMTRGAFLIRRTWPSGRRPEQRTWPASGRSRKEITDANVWKPAGLRSISSCGFDASDYLV